MNFIDKNYEEWNLHVCFDLKSVISEVCFLLKLSNLKHTNWVYGKHGIQNPEMETEIEQEPVN